MSISQPGHGLEKIYKEHLDNGKWEMDALDAVLSVLQTHNYSANETLLSLYGVVGALRNGIEWKVHAIQMKTGTAEAE